MNLSSNFKVLKECRGKLECLILEMLIISNKDLVKHSSGLHPGETSYLGPVYMEWGTPV